MNHMFQFVCAVFCVGDFIKMHGGPFSDLN